MYTPNYFKIENRQEAIDFIKRFSFGTLITIEDGLPIASHIPFTLRTDGDKQVLTSHIAIANSQCKTLLAGKALAIFTEPHAYISPSHYEKELNVPTWNYVAVHAYGNVTIIEDEQAKLAMLKDMITFYNDVKYLEQWETLPMDFKLKMIKGLVGFDITVDDLQGKQKLSQNRTDTEQRNIIADFGESTDTNEREIAAYMQKQQK